MSPETTFILNIGLLTIAALIFSLIFARFRLPVVSGQIIAGVIVGPHVLGFVTDPFVITAVSQLGVILLLFILGLELDPKEIRGIILKAGAITGIEVIVSFLLVFLGVFYLIHDFAASLVFAVSLSFASTAVVGRILLDYRGRGQVGGGGRAARQGKIEDYGKVLISVLVVEDVIAILFLVFIPDLSGAQSPSASLLSLAEIGVGGLALLLLSYLVGTYFAPKVINYFASFELESQEIPFLFSLGLGIIFGAIAVYFGFSPAIGSFVIGLSLRGKYSKFVSRQIGPIRDLFLILFFVSIGTLIDPVAAVSAPILFVLVIALAILSKFLGAYFSGTMFSTGLSASMFAIWLMPRGEFSMIIGQTALSSGIINEGLFSLVGIVVMITSLIGPIYLVSKDSSKSKIEFPLRPKGDD